MTLDLGAGPMEVLSNYPIVYGQWHELVIDRRGYYITVIVRSQEGQVLNYNMLVIYREIACSIPVSPTHDYSCLRYG